MDNDFLKKLESSQIREVVECMHEKKWKKDEYLIKEGESGSDLYVLEGLLLTFDIHYNCILFFTRVSADFKEDYKQTP